MFEEINHYKARECEVPLFCVLCTVTVGRYFCAGVQWKTLSAVHQFSTNSDAQGCHYGKFDNCCIALPHKGTPPACAKCETGECFSQGAVSTFSEKKQRGREEELKVHKRCVCVAARLHKGCGK